MVNKQTSKSIDFQNSNLFNGFTEYLTCFSNLSDSNNLKDGILEDELNISVKNSLKIRNFTDRNNEKRGVISTKVFELGDPILKFTPAIELLSNELEPDTEKRGKIKVSHIRGCLNCHVDRDFQAGCLEENGCSRCDKDVVYVYYCSEKCRDEDRLFHEVECLVLQHLKELNNGELLKITTTERLILRLMIKLKADLKFLNACKTLSSHHELFIDQNGECHKGNEVFIKKNERVWERTNNFYSHIEGFFNIDKATFFKIAFTIYVNCTTMSNQFNEASGLMFDPFFSLINHSCEPNVAVVWLDRQIELRPLKKINPGEELFVNYVAASLPKFVRKQLLMSNFYFDCQCSSCSLEYDKWLPTICQSCKVVTGGFSDEELWSKTNERMKDEIDKEADKDLIKCEKCFAYTDRMKQLNLYCDVVMLFRELMIEPGEKVTTEEFKGMITRIICEQCIVTRKEDAIKLKKILYEYSKTGLPFYSWPIVKVINLLQSYYEEDPILNLRYELIFQFKIKYEMEKEFNVPESLGFMFYEMCVKLYEVYNYVHSGKSKESDFVNFFNNKDSILECLKYFIIQSNKYFNVRYGQEEFKKYCLYSELKDMMVDIGGCPGSNISQMRSMNFVKDVLNLVSCDVDLDDIGMQVSEEDVSRFGIVLKKQIEGNVHNVKNGLLFEWLLSRYM